MVAARALVAVSVFGYILHSVDVSSVVTQLNPATAWAFVAGVLMLFGQLGLCAARWRLLFEPGSPRPGFADSYWAFIEGQFFNQALPSTVGGDAWRIVRLRAIGVSLRAAAASVFMDRASGAVGAAILAIIASAVLWHHGVDARLTVPVCCLGVAVIGGMAMFVAILHLGRLPIRRLSRLQNAIAELQGSLVLDRRYLASLGYSVTGHCVCGIALYVVARSIGIDLSPVLIVSVTVAVILILIIPISLGGWGLREAGFITLLAPLGVNSQDALLISILFGLMTLVSALPGGLSLLADRRAVHHKADGRLRSS